MSLLRPILKGVPTGELQLGIPSFRGGHVHFPPTPELSATFFVHSAGMYDRSAIVVSPNLYALPKRHCPERTYVLSEDKGEARLLKSVEPQYLQQEDEDDGDDREDAFQEYDRGAIRMDYFSGSSTPEMAWAQPDGSDELLSQPGKTHSNCGRSQVPTLEITVHDTQACGASQAHEHVQAALSFLSHPVPPAVDSKPNVSPHDHKKPDRAHTFSGGESNHCTPIARSRRPRRASSFTADVPPDLGCLGGF